MDQPCLQHASKWFLVVEYGFSLPASQVYCQISDWYKSTPEKRRDKKEKYNKTTVETKLYTVSQSYQQRGYLHADRPSVKKLFF